MLKASSPIVRTLKNEGHLSVGSLFLDSMAVNRRNMGQSDPELIALAKPDHSQAEPGSAMFTTGPVAAGSNRGVSMGKLVMSCHPQK